MDKDKQIIEKQDEYIDWLEREIRYIPTQVRIDYIPQKIMEAISKCESELASLKSQSKEEQCHTIYGKVKEAWTPDKRSFEEVEGAEMPESFRTLFRCLEDSCYEINFYGNDGNDNQEKIDGKETLIKWIKEAYIDSMHDFARKREGEK